MRPHGFELARDLILTLAGVGLLFVVALAPSVEPGVAANLVLVAGALCGAPSILNTIKGDKGDR